MYAMWQLPESMKQSQADLYLETYQVLDLEMSRLREIQQWQASASSKVCDFLPSFPFFSFLFLIVYSIIPYVVSNSRCIFTMLQYYLLM